MTILSALRQSRPDSQIMRGFYISLTQKYVYAPISKVANSSIKYFLFAAEIEQGGMGRFIHNSARLSDIHDPIASPLVLPYQLPAERFETLLTSRGMTRFAFVRNPYTRVLSCYLDRVQKVGSVPNRMIVELLDKGESDPIGFDEFIAAIATQEPRKMDPHWRPQSDEIGAEFITYQFLGRFEQLETDLHTILSRLYKPETVAQIDLTKNYSPAQTSAELKLRDHFSEKTIELVRKIYHKDFAQFGYPLDLP